jgi:hypothetical protein
MSHAEHIALCVLLAIASAFGSCTEKKKTNSITDVKEKAAAINFIKPGTLSTDTAYVDQPTAIFFKSDSLQLVQIEKKIPAMNYESICHDCFYQMRNAKNVMTNYWKDVKIIEVSHIRFLVFKKNDRTTKTIDLNTTRDVCGIYLFDPQKDPELIDMMNVDTALEFYYHQN